MSKTVINIAIMSTAALLLVLVASSGNIQPEQVLRIVGGITLVQVVRHFGWGKSTAQKEAEAALARKRQTKGAN